MKTLQFDNPQMKLYVASMGKIFRVTAVCKTDDEANAICKKDPDQSVMAVDCNGLIYLANSYSLTVPSSVLGGKE